MDMIICIEVFFIQMKTDHLYIFRGYHYYWFDWDQYIPHLTRLGISHQVLVWVIAAEIVASPLESWISAK